MAVHIITGGRAIVPRCARVTMVKENNIAFSLRTGDRIISIDNTVLVNWGGTVVTVAMGTTYPAR
jgi:hypothetical protein